MYTPTLCIDAYTHVHVCKVIMYVCMFVWMYTCVCTLLPRLLGLALLSRAEGLRRSEFRV